MASFNSNVMKNLFLDRKNGERIVEERVAQESPGREGHQMETSSLHDTSKLLRLVYLLQYQNSPQFILQTLAQSSISSVNQANLIASLVSHVPRTNFLLNQQLSFGQLILNGNSMVKSADSPPISEKNGNSSERNLEAPMTFRVTSEPFSTKNTEFRSKKTKRDQKSRIIRKGVKKGQNALKETGIVCDIERTVKLSTATNVSPYLGGRKYNFNKKNQFIRGAKRANELLEDSLLLNLEKIKTTEEGESVNSCKSSFSVGGINKLDNSISENKSNSRIQCAISAVENPKKFIDLHFPVPYEAESKMELEGRDIDMGAIHKIRKNFKLFLENIDLSSGIIYSSNPECNLINLTSNSDTYLNKPKRVWSPPINISDTELVDNLFKIEQVWPIHFYPFSLELALEFLMKYNYNFDKTKNLIKFMDKSFKAFLSNKTAASKDIEKIANFNKKFYQLRRGNMMSKY